MHPEDIKKVSMQVEAAAKKMDDIMKWGDAHQEELDALLSEERLIVSRMLTAGVLQGIIQPKQSEFCMGVAAVASIFGYHEGFMKGFEEGKRLAEIKPQVEGGPR